MAAKINWQRYGTKLRHCHFTFGPGAPPPPEFWGRTSLLLPQALKTLVTPLHWFQFSHYRPLYIQAYIHDDTCRVSRHYTHLFLRQPLKYVCRLIDRATLCWRDTSYMALCRSVCPSVTNHLISSHLIFYSVNRCSIKTSGRIELVYSIDVGYLRGFDIILHYTV